MKNNTFPCALSALRQWVCWRSERDDKSHRNAKIPYNPATGYKASPTAPETWGTLDQALEAKDKYLFSGIGFVFTAESGIIGIDIDHCLTDGQPNEVATAILAKLPPTYIEVSPSGSGLHIFIKGQLPGGGNKNSKTGVEMYGSHRYFTMTGNRFSNCVDEIALDNGVLNWIHTTFIMPKREPKSSKATVNQGISSLMDDRLLEMTRAAKDGAAFDALWRGDWQSKYKSQSEADFALCCKLAFWSNRDDSQINRLFRQSGLMREKWDAPHYSGGGTYGEITVRKACEATGETYAPKRKRPVSIFEQDNAYYRKKGENIHQLTNFIVKPIELIRAEDEAQLTCDLINENGKVCRQCLLADDFTNLQKFKKILNKNTISFSFFGTEGDLEALKQHLDGLDWQEKIGVKAMGIYKHKGQMVFVTPTKVQAAGGEPVETIIQMEKHRSLDSRILEYPLLTVDQMLSLGEVLFIMMSNPFFII